MNPVAKSCSGNPVQSLIPETIPEVEIYRAFLVLEQLVNCFLETPGGRLDFSHIHIISSKISLW